MKCLLIVFMLMTNSFAQESPPSKQQLDDAFKLAQSFILSLIDQYNEISKNINTTEKRSCFDDIPLKQKSGKCSFDPICNVLKQNIDKPSLYLGKNGLQIPNEKLRSIEYRLNLCLDELPIKKERELSKLQADLNKELARNGKEPYLILKKGAKDILQLRLGEAVEKAGKLAEFEAIEGIISGAILNTLRDGAENINKDALEDLFEKAVQYNGLTISNELKNEWLKYFNTVLNKIPETNLPDLFYKTMPILMKNSHYNYTTFDTKTPVGKEKISLLKKRIAEVKSLFEEVKNDIKNSLNLGIEENLRLEKLSIKTMFKPDELKLFCPVENNYYEPNHHRVIFCPQFYSLSDSLLKEYLLRSIGAAIDPCHLSHALMYEENSTLSRDTISLNPYEERKMKDLWGSKPIKYSDNLFKKKFKCFEDQRLVDFDADFKDFNSGMQDVKAYFRSKPRGIGPAPLNIRYQVELNEFLMPKSDIYNQFKINDRNSELFKQYGGCNPRLTQSRTQILWGKYLNRKLSTQNENITLEDIIESNADLITHYCALPAPSIEETVNDFILEAGCTTQRKLNEERIIKANARMLIKQATTDKMEFLLYHPKMRAALACDPITGDFCE